MKLFFIRYTFTDSKYIEITGDRITKQKEIQKVQRTILCYLPVLIALPPNAPSSSFFLIYCYQQCYLYVVRRTTLEDIILHYHNKKINNNNILHHDDDRYGSTPTLVPLRLLPSLCIQLIVIRHLHTCRFN